MKPPIAETSSRFVAARSDSDAARVGELFRTGRGVPRTLLNQAPARLMVMALVGAVVYTIHIGMSLFLHPAYMPMPADRTVPILAWLAFLMVSGGAALVGWRRWVSREVLLDIALLYMVVGAFFIAVAEHLVPWPEGYSVRGISWICAWIIAFQLTVPSMPLRALLGALSAAAMGPLLLVISGTMGNPMPSAKVLLALFVPIGLCALAAVGLSAMAFKLFRDFERLKLLGSYELLERLGEGGMGEVWRARHRMLARSAAIKLIRADRLGPETGKGGRVAAKRFEREARATATLTSQHTIDILDFGVAGDGRFYYVMEYLDGMDLETMIDRFGPMPAERAINILCQVCHSLAEAHSTGLVHRDIKPGNIFVCRRGLERDFAKVLDFGLVKLGTEREGDARLTAEGTVSGTPAYMSPEMATSPESVDHRSDIYGLGCVGYWLVAGRHVFEGSSALSIVMKHVQQAPPRLSGMTELEVPGALEELLLRCLAKVPEDRPQSAQELTHALAAIQTAQAWTQDRARAWWEQHFPEAAPEPPARTERASGRRLFPAT